MSFKFLVISFLLLFTNCEKQTTSFQTPVIKPLDTRIEGKVISVKDGDSIIILDSLNRQHEIRLGHIDCPEWKQDFGRVARTFTSDFCFGKQVTCIVEDTDRYERKVSRVEVNSNELNLALVKAGLAWHYKKYSSNRRYSRAESEARKKKIGLWAHPNPVPPWEFRGR